MRTKKWILLALVVASSVLGATSDDDRKADMRRQDQQRQERLEDWQRQDRSRDARDSNNQRLEQNQDNNC
jgi:Ni/Co efflux regulator RcnB